MKSPLDGTLRHLRLDGPLLAPLYLLLYFALDWASFIHPMRGLNITPWNPQAALAVALLLWRPRTWWIVLVGLAGGEAVAHAVTLPWPVVLASSVVSTAALVLTAKAMSRWLGPLVAISTRRQFLILSSIVIGGALLNALGYVGILAAFDITQPDRVLPAVLRSWVGDAVGLLVGLPVLFICASPLDRRRTHDMFRSMEWWLVVALSLAAAAAVFTRSTDEQFKFFYLFFLPVAWGAARFGVVGASWVSALVQLLLIAAVIPVNYRPLTVFELQMLMSALAAMGLLLGTTVEEREHAEAELRASLRLAVAGDTAAALAHELNQPLAALGTYARASQMLAEGFSDQRPGQVETLRDVSNRLVIEADRASDVVKRLRNFFRERSTDLQLTDLGHLLADAVAAQVLAAESQKVRLSWHADSALPPIWIDRIQIAIVLRNMITNAIEAAASSSSSHDRWVEIRLAGSGTAVSTQVMDSGAGVELAKLESVFGTGASNKADGMGIGLGICRSIVEAHGGRFWAEPGPGGRFFMQLPIRRQAVMETAND